MDFDALMAIFADFDVAAFLPRLDSLLGWVEMVLRLLVMAGPLLLLGFGLLYLLAPPKEANYSVGWRFWWSMASLDAWQFTHRWTGYVWSGLGLLLTIIMAFVCNAFRRMAPMEMVWAAAKRTYSSTWSPAPHGQRSSASSAGRCRSTSPASASPAARRLLKSTPATIPCSRWVRSS